MKRIMAIVMALFLVAGTAALFANGQSENAAPSGSPQAQNAPGQFGPGWGGYGARNGNWGELQTLTGKISFEDWMHPTLTIGSKEYELMVSSRLAYEAGLKEGDTLTISGHVYSGTLPPWVAQDKSVTPVWVATATFAGKTYDLANLRGRWDGYGPRGYGMMYGPGYGPMMGSRGNGYGYGPGMGYGPGRGYGPGMMGWGSGR